MTLSGNAWTEQQIYSFLLPDESTTGLAIAAGGNIFGVGHSIVFELSPNGGGGWTPTVIHKFGSYPLGYIPEGGPVLDKAGNVYGTTTDGGAYGYGVVYKLSPRKKQGPYTRDHSLLFYWWSRWRLSGVGTGVRYRREYLRDH